MLVKLWIAGAGVLLVLVVGMWALRPSPPHSAEYFVAHPEERALVLAKCRTYLVPECDTATLAQRHVALEAFSRATLADPPIKAPQ